MRAPLRFALAGAGRHGSRYARHLARGDVPGATLHSLWRRDAAAGEALAQEVDARYQPTFDALLEDDEVDAFILAVPAGLNEPLATRIAARGRPLLLEKPIARTVAEGQRIVDAFARAGAPLTVAQTLRFDPLVARGREVAAPLGPLRGFGFEQRIEPRGLPWEEDPSLSGGGVLAQTAVHAADTLRFVTGAARVEVVNALLGRVHYPANEDHGLVHIRLYGLSGESDEGVLGDLRVSKIGQSRHHRYALFCDRGGVELDFIDREIVVTEGRRRRRVAVPEVPTVPAVTAAFIRFVADGAPNPVRPEDALQSLTVIEDAYAVAQRTGGSSTTSPASLTR